MLTPRLRRTCWPSPLSYPIILFSQSHTLSFFEHRLEKSADGLQSGHLASQLFPSSILSRCASSYIFLGAPMCISSPSSDQRFQSVGSLPRYPTWVGRCVCVGGVQSDKGRMEQAREWVIQEAKSCHNAEPKHLFLVPSASQVSLLLSTHCIFFPSPRSSVYLLSFN